MGHVRLITDGTGASVYSASYDAWGNLLAESGSLAGSWFYGYMGAWGCRRDADTGLVYCRERWLDTSLQRFISRDVLGGQNRYAYCFNSPTGLEDSNGMEPGWRDDLKWAREHFPHTDVAPSDEDSSSSDDDDDVSSLVLALFRDLVISLGADALAAATEGAGTPVMIMANGRLALSAGRVMNVATGARAVSKIGYGAAALDLGMFAGKHASGTSGCNGYKAGQAGLSKVPGAVQNTTFRITPATGANYRIPDVVRRFLKLIEEFKNVKSLHKSKQLVDFMNWAQKNGWGFILYVRSTTKLSKPLLDEITRLQNAGVRIILRKWL